MKFIASPLNNQITEFTELHSGFNVPAKREENRRELIRKQIRVLIEDIHLTVLKKKQRKESTILHLLKEKKEWNKTRHLTESKVTMQNEAFH